MIPDLDVYRSVNTQIKHNGDEAPIYASMRHDELLAAGDTGGCTAWKRIMRAIEELQAERPSAGSKTH